MTRTVSTVMTLSVLAAACAEGPRCGPGTRADGDRCLPSAPVCADGLLVVGGACQPAATACAAGTTLRDGTCVPEATLCGPGTTLVDGQCRPVGAPPADVSESVTPGMPAVLEPPLIGETRTLGGVIDTPVDEDEDTYVDADWDDFAFVAAAGTYWRVSLTSSGDAHPAAMLVSEATDAEGWPLYTRFLFDPNAAEASREVYLPFDGTYTLWVTDFANLWPWIFGWGAVPVGGPGFDYQVAVENLGPPSVRTVETLPLLDAGALSDGRLRFYSVDTALADVALRAVSLGEPRPERLTEIYPALLAFDDAGRLLAERSAGGLTETIALLLPTVTTPRLLIVQDFLMVVGPTRDYHLSIQEQVPLECPVGDCTTGSISERSLLRFDLQPGDLVAAGVYVPENQNGTVTSALLTPALTPLAEPSSATHWRNGAHLYLAVAAEQVLLWVEKQPGAALTDFSVEAKLMPTPKLERGVSRALTVEAMPDGVLPPTGVAHLPVLAGELVVSVGLSTPGWSAPRAALWTSALLDLRTTDATDRSALLTAVFEPLVARAPRHDLVLHLVQDDEADATGAAYTAGLAAAMPELLPAPTERAGEQLDPASGVRVYALLLDAFAGVDLEVIPQDATLQPELWLLVPGQVATVGSSFWWRPEASAPRLGLLARAIADAPGQVVRLPFAPARAETVHYLVVRDARNQVGAPAPFTVRATARPRPVNDTCAGATLLDLTAPVTLTVDTTGAGDSLDLGGNNSCTRWATGGPDLFWAVDLAEGDTLTVSAAAGPAHDAVLYLFSDCAAAVQCAAAAATAADPEVLTWQVPAGAAGRYRLALDAQTPTSMGAVTLSLQRAP